MDTQREYILGTSDSELARLRRQNEAVGRETGWMLDRLGIQPGWRIADIGCGPLGALEMLSERSAPGGTVVGVDVSEVMVAQARAAVSAMGRSGIEVVRADASRTELPRASFDLVHSRLLLINVSNPAEIVAEMVALARPGGVVAIEEIDGSSWTCDPGHEAWDRLYGAFLELFARRGCDGHIGRRLPSLLRQAGLTSIESEVHIRVHGLDHPWRHLLLQFIQITRPGLVGMGLLTEREIDELTAALRLHLDDPRTTLIAPIFAQAWGIKPDPA